MELASLALGNLSYAMVIMEVRFLETFSLLSKKLQGKKAVNVPTQL